MKIAKGKVVVINYSLKDSEGTLIESSLDEEPLIYLHGSGFLIPGLEKAMEGKSNGDTVKAAVSPEDGYGEYDKELVFTVPKSEFPKGEPVEVGMQFHSHSEEEDHIFIVKEISGDSVTLDANHPLAGQHLNFEISILDVRDATSEELDHGHAHDGHNHHH